MRLNELRPGPSPLQACCDVQQGCGGAREDGRGDETWRIASILPRLPVSAGVVGRTAFTIGWSPLLKIWLQRVLVNAVLAAPAD
jgi:hypothetical protein